MDYLWNITQETKPFDKNKKIIEDIFKLFEKFINKELEINPDSKKVFEYLTTINELMYFTNENYFNNLKHELVNLEKNEKNYFFTRFVNFCAYLQFYLSTETDDYIKREFCPILTDLVATDKNQIKQVEKSICKILKENDWAVYLWLLIQYLKYENKI